MKLCFTGDVFLGGDLLNKNISNKIQVKSFNNADKRIVNLEQPISDNELVQDKCTLYTGSYAVNQLKEIKVDAVNLAHNHIQDKGLEGIEETIDHLNNLEIGSFGAGKNIQNAKRPYSLDEDLFLFGYCDYDRVYLNQIEVANKNKAGINPLRYENIIEDLNTLKVGQKAILYFHWGQEHVSFPKYRDITLAKKILKDDRVLLILGMHCHRIQGYISYNGKKAYMSLGNFLFPNFFIKPPTQIYYPEDEIDNYLVTRQYHYVYKTTYKKWRKTNRTSLLIDYDTKKGNIDHFFVCQEDDSPTVKDVKGIEKLYLNIKVSILSKIYNLPKFIYIPIEKANSTIVYFLWRLRIRLFHLRQLGIKNFLKKVLVKYGYK